MVKAEPTPGPWELEWGARYVRIVHKDDSMGWGVRVIAKFDDVDDAEVIANAALMAASQKLRYALQAFVDYYEQAGIGEADPDDPGDGFDGDECFNVRLARAAVAASEIEVEG